MSRKMLDRIIEKAITESDLLIAMTLSMIMTYLKALVNNPEAETARTIFKSITCSFLTLGAWYLIKAFGYDTKYAVFVGVCIGYIGPETLRLIIIKYLEKKV